MENYEKGENWLVQDEESLEETNKLKIDSMKEHQSAHKHFKIWR